MKIVFIGYKNHAKRLMFIFSELGYCQEILVYYPDFRKLSSNFSSDGISCKVQLTSSIDDLYEANAIVIASPTHTHCEYLKLILNKFQGYIFCEKPPCKNLKELDFLYALEDRDKSRIYFNFNYRSSVFSQICQSAIESREYGVPISLSFSSCHGLAFKSSFSGNWRNISKEILENVIGNVGIHYVDLAFHLMGNGTSVSFSAIKVSEYTKFSDSALIIVSSQVGLHTTILLSYASPFHNTATFVFSDAIIELINGVVSVKAPRDSLDKDGLFAPPPVKFLKRFSSSREYYNDSMKNSVCSFLNVVKKSKTFPLKQYRCSLDSTKVFLSMQEK